MNESLIGIVYLIVGIPATFGFVLFLEAVFGKQVNRRNSKSKTIRKFL